MDKLVFVPTIVLFILASLLFILGGGQLQATLSSILNWIDTRMSWAYMMVYVVNFLFFMYLAFGKFGKVKLGDPEDKPHYSNFQWGSMVFATAIDASILMLSIVDPLRYLQHPAFGFKPFSSNAYSAAHMLGQFNWGPMAWMMFAPATIAIAYVLYVKHGKVQRVSAAITSLQGDSKGKVVARHVVDFLVVFGIMGGIGSSVGMEIPIISKVLSRLTGVQDNLMLKIELFIILFILFAVTVFHGLNGGINRLSSAHIWTALGLLAIILIIGPTVYILNSETNSIGLMAQKFVAMSTNTLPNGGDATAQQETIFYWGWWLSYMPVMGLFIARISKGRTIRQVLVGMLTYGALGCMSFYAIFGGYSLWLQRTGAVNLVHILNTQGQAAVVATVIATLPFKMIILALYCISCFIFLATTISSSAFIVSSFTSLHLDDGQEPSRWNRMIWVIVFIIFSFGIVMVGGFKTVQTVSTIAGFPLMFVCILLLHSIWHMLAAKPKVAPVVVPQPVVVRRITVELPRAVRGPMILSPDHAN
nr:BCCT family transporter [Levilactobacillus mulengensis]